MKDKTLTTFVNNHYLPYARRKLKPRTVKEYTRLLDKLILPEFGARNLSALTQPGIERWHLALAEGTPVQANRALAVLSGVLTYAVRHQCLPVNPAQGIEYITEEGRESVLTRGQVRTFLSVVRDHLSAEEGSFLLTLLYTGARPGELTKARWEWLRGDELQLPDSKTGKRTVYLPHAALCALSPVRGNLDDPRGLIWPSVDYEYVWRRVKVLAEGGLDGVRPYDLRHTFATAALDGGAPLEAISQLLGHSDPRTTRKYVHLRGETARKALGGAERAISALGETQD